MELWRQARRRAHETGDALRGGVSIQLIRKSPCTATWRRSLMACRFASHMLIKHAESRNPISRRTNESTAALSKADAESEMNKWIAELEKDTRPMAEKFAALAFHRSDCGSFEVGGDLGEFTHGEMQQPFEEAVQALNVGEVSGIVTTDSGTHIIFRTA